MRSTWLVLAAGGLAVAGCQGPTLPPETDPGKGRAALRTVLDTWKAGGSPDDLKKGSPPITARDPDWGAGAKLTTYEIADEEARAGTDLLLTVKLTLAPPTGPPREKTVKYVVAVGSSTVVLRNE